MTNNTSRRVLSVFSLTMITIGSVDSIRNLPSTALFGSSLIFFFILGAIFFLIPTALVAAELSSSWTAQGGIYNWSKEAFGKRTGFLAIWFQWVENLFWYPTILAFIGGTIAYITLPRLANDNLFLVTVILVVFWAVTLINLYGMRVSAWVSSFCAIAGLLIPMTTIILFGIFWLVGHHPLQITFTKESMLPHLAGSDTWVALTGIMLSFCGMEIATVHGADVKNPRKTYPRALLLSVVIIASTLMLGSLAIAVVLPKDQISLVAGIMQAFGDFFGAYHLQWIIPVMGVLLVIGIVGSVNNWTIAPLKGLMVAAEDENIPQMLGKGNERNAPTVLLLIQGVVVSAITMVFLLLPSINESYWLLTTLTAQLYMFMYLIMFAAGIMLRFKKPDHPRPYRIPGGKYCGMLIVAGAGIIASLVTIVIGFIPPTELHIKDLFSYEALIIGGLLIMIVVPLVIAFFSKMFRS